VTALSSSKLSMKRLVLEESIFEFLLLFNTLMFIFILLLAVALCETFHIKDFNSKWLWNIKSSGLYEVDFGMDSEIYQ
jgi:hypothetical protein